MLYFALLTILCMYFAAAQETETNPEQGKSQCIKRMVDWCDDMQYSQNSTSMSMISLSYGDMQTSYRVFCVADSDGTNCSRNGSPWFSCSPDHTLTYKGRVMTQSSTDVNDDICNTTRKAFDELSLQTLSNSNVLNFDVQTYLQDLRDEMAQMMNMFRNFRMELGPLFGGGFGYRGGFFPDQNFDGDSDSEQTSTRESNQLERENK